MTLKERISADYMSAFKAKNTVAKNLLSVIKGEIQTIEKNTGTESLSDEEVTKILNKTVKSLKETQSKSATEQTAEELSIVESYLPKQMSQDEIDEKVMQLIAEGAGNIGAVMKAFAELPADKKAVSAAFARLK